MDLRVLLPEQLQAGVDEESSKDVDQPVEAVDQPDAGKDEDRAHDERAQYPPEEHGVLVVLGNFEIAKDQQENEQVIDGERFLDEVSGEELEREHVVGPRARGHRVSEEEQQDGEAARQRDPDRSPGQRLPELYDVLLAMKNAEVERQHRQHEEVERQPEDPVLRHRFGF